jgi:hypothetical protein
MTEIQRLAFTTAFLAAVVVAGLSLSLVPHVELVTLVVFASGVLLGGRGGAQVGGLGMPLYVLANSALRGFPPSPLPILLAQGAGMALVGMAGGLWRGVWCGGPRYRPAALAALPVLGVLLSLLYQAILNAAFALFLGAETGPRLTAFLSGMAFGILDAVWNGVVFAAAGPVVAVVLRRTARARGWWGAALAILVLAAGWSGPALAQEPVGSGAAPPDSSRGAPPDTVSVPPPPGTAGWAAQDTTHWGGLDALAAPAWMRERVAIASVEGDHGVLADGDFPAASISYVTSPAYPPSVGRWGLGWSRSRFSYEGVPLNGPVYGFASPLDLPLAWRGRWKSQFTASGTAIDLGAPPPAEGDPLSQISLTTGGLSRRTAEFALFRAVGPVDMGLDFFDGQQQGIFEGSGGLLALGNTHHDRVWFRLSQSAGRRPDWSVDISTASSDQDVDGGARLTRKVRRIQGTLEGPLLGGQARLALQARRQALGLSGSLDDFGEVKFRGITAQGDWSGPAGLGAWARWQSTWRSGVLPEDRSFPGIEGGVRLRGRAPGVRWGLEGGIGTQEPYGFTWSGLGVLQSGPDSLYVRISLSHEEDLPPMVLGVDRIAPEVGMDQYLADYEATLAPEERSALRVEGSAPLGPFTLTGGGWGARVRNYRIDSNPLWVSISEYAPFPAPPAWANLAGVYGNLRIDFTRNLYGLGDGLYQSRKTGEVPYLPSWTTNGSLHWRESLFKDSIDLDLSLGGSLIGKRSPPLGILEEPYPVAVLGWLRLYGQLGNGIFTITVTNPVDNFVEADVRFSDLVTPMPVPGRLFTFGLTMYLTQ